MKEKKCKHSKILKEIHNEKEKILCNEYRYALDIIADRMHKKEHFIRELIQNADDANSRKILFEVDIKNRNIKVTNWGKCFNKKDVKQICTILPSQKKTTQIGSLGVGFKSIFSISDKPKIFSGGFNFEITEYILPTEIKPILLGKKETVFLIPFRKDINVKDIIEKFSSLNKDIILFLKNIEEIKVKYTNDKNEGFTIRKNIVSKTKFNRLRLEYTTITKKDNNNCDETKWYIFKRRYKVPKKRQNEIRETLKNEMKRIYKSPEKYFQSSEIKRKVEEKVLKSINPSIAILSTKQWRLNKMAESKLFIGLPSEIMTGLKFHINAEFKPTADRTDIERIRINEWIISKTTDLICEMMEFMKNTNKYQDKFYSILPGTKDTTRILDKEMIFEKIFQGILEYFETHNMILTSNQKWAKKDEVCFPDHEELRKLLSKKDLQKNFGKKYFISDNLGCGSKAFLKSIEKSTITINNFIDFLSNKDNLKDKSPSWFFDVYAYLGKYLKKWKSEYGVIEKLKNAHLIFTENKTLESIFESDKAIYFPPETNLDETYNLFKKDLFFVHRRAFPPSDKGKKKSEKWNYAKRMLDELGVKKYKPVSIIDDIVLKKFELEDDDFNFLDREGTLNQYIAYIKNHFEEYRKKHKDNWKEIRKKIKIRTKNGTYKLPEKIYLPSEYNGNKDLELLFDGIDKIIFVDDKYLTYNKGKGKKDKKDSWYSFFRKLGVEDKPRILTILKEEQISPLDEIIKDVKERSTWYHKILYDKKSEDIKKVIDWIIANGNKKGATKAKILLKILSAKWKEYIKGIEQIMEDEDISYKYKSFEFAEYNWFYHKWRPKETISHLKYTITLPWIPTTKGILRKPSEVYINNEKIKNLVGEDNNFLTIDLENKDLIGFLGLKEEAKLEDKIKNLLNIASKDFNEMKIKFILKTINNTKNMVELIKIIGEQNKVNNGLIKLTNIVYEKFNNKIRESEREDEPIYEDSTWKEFKDNVKILTENFGFCSPSKVFFPPSPYLDKVLKRSKIMNFPLLPTNYRKYETFARKIGVIQLEYGLNVKCKLIEPNRVEIGKKRKKFIEFEQKIKKIVPYLNGVETKKIENKNNRWEYEKIFRNIKVYCLPKLELQYFITQNDQKYTENSIPSPVYLHQNNKQTELYIRTNDKNNKGIMELIANELSLLTNPSGDQDYMAKTIKECLLGYPPMNINKIEDVSQYEETKKEKKEVEVETLVDKYEIVELQDDIETFKENSEMEKIGNEIDLFDEEFAITELNDEEETITKEYEIKEQKNEKSNGMRPKIEESVKLGNIEEKPKKPIKKLRVTTIRDSKKSNQVKKHYRYHCQICLSFKKPELLSYYESYTGIPRNQIAVMRAHHIDELEKDKGYDHTGNLISICYYHHTILHKPNVNFGIRMIEKQLNNLEEIKIEWPNGKIDDWKILRSNIKVNQKEIQFVITPIHLKKIKQYIKIINEKKSM